MARDFSLLLFFVRQAKACHCCSTNEGFFTMSKLLVAAAAALLSAVPLSATAIELQTNRPPSVAHTDPGTSWVALAVSRNGRVFQSESSNGEELARRAARSECERTSGRTCRDTMSVPDFWSVVVLRCGNRYFLGGSGEGNAYAIALAKAAAKGFSDDSCRQIASR
jgi:hypothetical protein